MKYDFSQIANIPEVSNAFYKNINQNFSFILQKHNLSANSNINYLWENSVLNLSFIITDTSFSVFNEKKIVESYSFTNIYKLDFDKENKEFAVYYSKDYIYAKISGDFFGIDNTISIDRYSEIATQIKDFLNPLFQYFENIGSQTTVKEKQIDTNKTLDKEEIINWENMEVRDIIINEIKNNTISSNYSEVFYNENGILVNIPKDKLFKIREINGLDKNTEILYARFYQFHSPGDFWEASRTVTFSTIFLEDRISIRQIIESTGWSKEPDYILDLYWEEIEEVEVIYYDVKDENGKVIKEYAIRVFYSLDNQIVEIPISNFLLGNKQNSFEFEQRSFEFIKIVNNILLNIKNIQENNNGDLEKIIEEIREKSNNGDFENALNLIKNNFDLNTIIESNSMIYYFLIYHNSLCLRGLGNSKEALKLLDERIIKSDTSEGYKEWDNSLFKLKAEINEDLGNHYNSLQNFYFAFQNTQEIELKSNLKEKINSSYNNFKESFGELQYDKRKMILIYDEVKISPSDSFIVLDKSNLPKNIKFPLTHPKKEEIYIGHPYLKESYLPFSSFEANLFNDRFEEFSYFIQCLGAKSMTIKVIKENEKIIKGEKSTNTSGSAEFGKKIVKNSINGSYEDGKDSENKEDFMTSRTRTQIYNPSKKPYVPENLLWYPHETSWHRIYQQRISGNILSHHDIISSKSTHSISNSEKSNLKAGLKTFYADINLNRDTFIKNTIDESESIEWEILVEFESIENLKEDGENTILSLENSTFSDAENQYKEEILFMLDDDGIIDEKERRILNRLKDKLGITDEKANKLENEILSLKIYTPNEKEYIEEYKEFLNDGEITEKERRILNRFATRLELTEERILQLENSLG